MAEDEAKSLLRLPQNLKDEVWDLANARTRSLNGQLVELIKVGLKLEHVAPMPGELAYVYRDRLRRVSDGTP